MKHLFYTGGWKKMEDLWNIIINTGGLQKMLPILELLLMEANNLKKRPDAEYKYLPNFDSVKNDKRQRLHQKTEGTNY